MAELRSVVRREMTDRSEPAVQLIDAIRSALPRDAIIVGDVTTCAYWGWNLSEVYQPRTFLYPWGFATLGFGLPAAIGAKVARPATQVLAICSDGGFGYTATELATAVQYGINVGTLLVNDNKYGILEPQQMARFGRTTMTELQQLDFSALATTFGALGVSIDRIGDVERALPEAFGAERPAVVELRTTMPSPFNR